MVVDVLIMPGRFVRASLLLVALAVQAHAAVVVRGPWSGGVTDTSAVVVARVSEDAADPRLEWGEQPAFDGAATIAPLPAAPGTPREIVRFQLTGLKPGMRYHYRVRGAGAPDGSGVGEFTTCPPAGAPASFRFAFASCGRTGSANPVYTRIKRMEPLFYLNTGDLHYSDIAENSRVPFRAAYDKVLGSPTQGDLHRHVAFAYVWDDHDFGPNGADRLSPSREASYAVYREYVPHHPLAWDVEHGKGDGPISHAFTVGRARFIVLDCRSQRDPAADPDVPGKTMLGAWQKAWFQRELLAANGRFPLIFVVSSVSWVSDEHQTRDNWGRYTAERAELSDWMVAQGIRGVCFLSGDAHMLAADDGSHDNYARGGGPGFPALQAAPLDKDGSIKGGPWSVAPVLPEKGEGQFGLVDVNDRGDRIDVLFRGLNHEGREKLRLEFSVPARP